MYYFNVEAFAPTASYRLPEAHTFQQTLPLPPITALVGMAGAAMGLTFEQAMATREEGLLCAVWGRHGGEAGDLWKYRKIKSGEVISAVLTREILFSLELHIVYAHRDRKRVDALREAFLAPVYALSAGTSDDLLKLRRVGDIMENAGEPRRHFENTVLPGDHSNNYQSAIKPENIPVARPVRAPRVFLLPVSFNFAGEERRVNERAHYTFVDTPVILTEPLPAITSGGKVLPLL